VHHRPIPELGDLLPPPALILGTQDPVNDSSFQSEWPYNTPSVDHIHTATCPFNTTTVNHINTTHSHDLKTGRYTDLVDTQTMRRVQIGRYMEKTYVQVTVVLEVGDIAAADESLQANLQMTS